MRYSYTCTHGEAHHSALGRTTTTQILPRAGPNGVAGAASLLEPTSRTPRLLAYSSPVPKILPLTLLPPAQEEVEVLHPVRQEGLERRALLEGQPKDRLGVEQQLDEQKPLERQFMERRLQELRLQASRLSGRELCSSSPVSNLFIYQARGV